MKPDEWMDTPSSTGLLGYLNDQQCCMGCWSFFKTVSDEFVMQRKVDGNWMKTITLSQGKEVVVDDPDFEDLNQFKWTYTRTTDGHEYAIRRANGKTLYMHRWLLGVHDRSVKIDHINGNGLDNQRQNLRLSTNAQNLQNRKMHANKKSSGFKGVFFARKSYRKRDGTEAIHERWQVEIQAGNRKRFIGAYDDEIQAAKAYDVAASILHGRFAKLNFGSSIFDEPVDLPDHLVKLAAQMVVHFPL